MANWQGELNLSRSTCRQDRDLACQTGREGWTHAGPRAPTVASTGTWHSNLAGNTDMCRSTWSAGHQYRDLARQTGKECWTCLGPRGGSSEQGPGTSNWQGALDACMSTWCAGCQDRDLAC